MPEPGKTICLGLNYFDHAKEGGREKPEYPWFFFRGASSLLGHGEPGAGAAGVEQVRLRGRARGGDRQARAAPCRRGDALGYVFGYSCFNDMSVRDYQKRTPQWTIGKNFDATGGFGPVLVTRRRAAPGAAGLRIQAGSTARSCRTPTPTT